VTNISSFGGNVRVTRIAFGFTQPGAGTRRATLSLLGSSLGEARKDLRGAGQTQPGRSGSDHF
jgi:hypothetical protein